MTPSPTGNRVELYRQDDVDYIIKWNLRKQDPEAWRMLAFSKEKVDTLRPAREWRSPVFWSGKAPSMKTTRERAFLLPGHAGQGVYH
jgi:hypothetical protein